MAADWLDIARYSDTYGYQVDRDRRVWPWRDWVIESFNQNMPYDQFVIEQLAGDLLPDATDQQILATTFNRLHPQKVEGGSVEEEFRVEYVADRTQTMGTAFMGLTLECARCHDHKFDPLSQAEYYQLFAFFNNIDEAGLYSYFTPAVPTPTLALPDQAQRERLAAAEHRLQEVTDSAPDPEPSEPDYIRSLIEDWEQLRGPIESLDFGEAKLGANQGVEDDRGEPAVELTGDDAIGLKTGNFRRYQPFSVSLSIWIPDHKERAVIFHRSRAWTDAGSRGYQLLLEDGRLSGSLIHFWPGNALRVRTKETLPLQTWIDVAWVYDGSSQADGLRLFVDGVAQPTNVVRDQLTRPITGGGGDQIAIGARFRDRGFKGGRVARFQVWDRQLSGLEVQQLHRHQSLAPAPQPDEADEVAAEHWLEHWRLHGSPDWQAYAKELLAARQAVAEAQAASPEIMVMRELSQPRPAFVLERGNYASPTEPVSAATPEVLPPLAPEFPRNRLGLAKWLVSKEHPLTSRVAVNHYWQVIFGEGLVRTPEDFGRQGQRPTHPELLDWLATDFRRHGWDVKRLIKQMVMSRTYRQSSVASDLARQRDPENRWLSRSPSFRWSAEMLRDSVLSTSGLLVDRVGGPPVKPYELSASFKPATPDSGEGLYRRSLYTYWKRTGPAPAMMVLDASKRDVCRVKRERTSTPLQALTLVE